MIFSHVNGSKRKSLNGKSPYEAFVYFFNEEVASLFGIRYISAVDVVQDKRLLNTLNKTPLVSDRTDEPGLHS